MACALISTAIGQKLSKQWAKAVVLLAVRTDTLKAGSGIHFYRFPEKAERRARWVAAVGRKNWAPNEHSWICSVHFVSGAKSNDPLSPDYVPSVFSYTKSPVKRKLVSDMERYERKDLLTRDQFL